MKKTILILSAVTLSFFGKELNAQQIPTQDLVVEYKFDNDNLIETSGSTYNAGGLTSSGTVSYVQGIETATSAISPDGASLSNVGNITFSGNVKEYVVSFWFKANQGTGDFKLLELKDPGSSNGLTINVLNNTNNTSTLTVNQVSSGTSPSGSYNSFESYLDNEWHHLAVKLVYRTSGLKYYLHTYLDDVEVMDEQYPVSLYNVWVFGGLDIYLPSQATGNGTSQDLKIDNFRFYEFPITQTDITALYNEENASASCANIVNIPDANFKAALLAQGTTITGTGISPIDTDGDGEICESEAQAYTGTIYILGQGINDLTGIEAFTSLTILNCSHNNLTNLDFSANTALIRLDCTFNQLTSLNVANGNNNLMPVMFAHNNPNLTCIQHDAGYTPEPYTGGEGWNKDATASWSTNCNSSCANIVNIPDANFKAALLAQGTTITGPGISPIDTDGDGEICEYEAQAYTGIIYIVSQGINDLTGIEAFTSLGELNCMQNNLTNLDVSANTALIRLDCSLNQLTSLNVANGNNNLMSTMFAHNNPNLTCIQHDAGYTPVPYSQGQGWNKDATASWSTNCNSSCANIVNIPDANFKTRLLEHGTILNGPGISPIDTDGDGEICESEAQAYTGRIQLAFQGISDLTGIEAFTSVTELNCVHNNLTNLDVSANTALIRLECFNNQLTSLNVANGNNNLMSTMAAHNNPNLTCIQHDAGYTPEPYTGGEGWMKDATASWSENCGTAGLEDFESALNISIYPNPTNGEFSIDLGETIQSLTIYITDITGKEVYSNGYKSTQKVNLNLNDSPGVYFVTIEADGVQSKYKLIKK
nr:T9SS type A sorting domain-containing protein [uncultured Brumimicrobium sp.]